MLGIEVKGAEDHGGRPEANVRLELFPDRDLFNDRSNQAVSNESPWIESLSANGPRSNSLPVEISLRKSPAEG